MDGIEALKEMKKIQPRAEVLLLTGHASVETSIEGMKLGAFDYLLKPVKLEDLLLKLAEAFEKKDAPVVYIKSEISDPILNLLNNSYKKGSRKAELDKRLLVVSNYIISKSRGDAFSNPQLDKLLIGKQVNHLIITGLDAAHCVNSTIQAAKNRGYMITVISDAVISKTDSIKQVKLKEFSRNGIEVVSSEDYLMELKKPE